MGPHGRARFSDAFAVPQNVFKQQTSRFHTLGRGAGKSSGTLRETFRSHRLSQAAKR